MDDKQILEIAKQVEIDRLDIGLINHTFILTTGRLIAFAQAIASASQPADPAGDEPVRNNYHEAYRGARDDMQDWKKRALKAEGTLDKLWRSHNAENGPTHLGEPCIASVSTGDAS